MQRVVYNTTLFYAYDSIKENWQKTDKKTPLQYGVLFYRLANELKIGKVHSKIANRWLLQCLKMGMETGSSKTVNVIDLQDVIDSSFYTNFDKEEENYAIVINSEGILNTSIPYLANTQVYCFYHFKVFIKRESLQAQHFYIKF